VQQPREHSEQDPNNEKSDNDLHGARAPPALIGPGISQLQRRRCNGHCFLKVWSISTSKQNRPAAHASAARYRPGVTPVSRRKIDVR
jgi:hypothetical protein